MASHKEYLTFVLDQLSLAEDVSFRPMMGEYVFYCRGKVVGGIYDDRLLVKRTDASLRLLPGAPSALPYPGGREMLVVEDPENRELLAGLFAAIAGELPPPKEKKRKLPEKITVKKVEQGTPLAAALLDYIRDFSWDEVKEHLLEKVGNWEFTGWETMLAAMDGDRIVGMCALLKTDYYPLPEIYPWVSCLFVSEPFRGKRLSARLIDAANDYAKTLGFARTYIPSIHTGLYEKYGYAYLRDIVNYGGETDRLYVKEL